MDQLKTMESFIHVVEAKSFSVAAKELGLSRALITKRIQVLEDHIGARLLNRTTRSLALTEIGTQYYDFCRRILGEIEGEERSLGALQREPRGSLRVLAPKSFSSLHLCDMVASFGQRYPEIRLTLVLDDSSVRAPDLVDKGYDVAVRLSEIDDSTLVARKIATLRWVVCAAPAYLARQGEPKNPSELAGHNCLTHLTMGSDHVWRFGDGRRAEQVRVQGSFTSNSVIALRHAACAGMGVAMLPTYCVAPDLASGALVQILAGCALRDRPLYAVYPYGALPPKKVRLFVDFTARWFKRPDWEMGRGGLPSQ